MAGPKNKRPVQQRYHKPVPQPGTFVFDSLFGMRELPPKIRNTRAGTSPSTTAAGAQSVQRVRKASAPENSVDETVAVNSPANSHDFQHGNRNLTHLTPQSIGTPQESPYGLSPLLWSSCATPPNTEPSIAPPPSWPTVYPSLDKFCIPSEEKNKERVFGDDDLVGIGSIFEGLGKREAQLELDLQEYQQVTSKSEDDQLWSQILETNKLLLGQYHDIFRIHQDENAPEALKYLACKFVMPIRMWDNSFKTTLDVLRGRLPRSSPNMEVMMHLAYESLEKLSVDVPGLKQQWDYIRWKLHEYVSALQEDGVDIPISFIKGWVNRSTEPSGSNANTFSSSHVDNSMDGNPYFERNKSIGDDVEFEWYYEECFKFVVGKGVTWCKNSIATTRIRETAQLLMFGWLHYGRKLAMNFHGFCQVFIFLGLLGAGAYY